MLRESLIETLLREKLIAVLRLSPEATPCAVRALASGGIRCVELAFEPENEDQQLGTARLIRALTDEFGEDVLVGAGTVTHPALVDLARDAGARFIVSPGMNADVIARTREANLVSIPGAMTPTEILNARHAGADIVKLFPADCLGAAYLRALRAPLGHIPLFAFGGIDAGNIAAFLEAGAAGVGVSSCLFDRDRIAAGDYEGITHSARILRRAARLS